MLDKLTAVAVVGLGYVGFPIAVEFGKKIRTIGFDLSKGKITKYKRGEDPTGEVPAADQKAATLLEFTTDPSLLAEVNFIIVAVPTPVDSATNPDLTPLERSSETIARHLKKGTTIVYESTVYPGATEEVCIPILERVSGLTWKKDFFVGYSPERINPGDKEHTLTRITKIVAGDSKKTLELVAQLYESIITAGVHRAASIQVAEAAKVIENTQRDLNISLMNEFSLILHKLNIDTLDVLEAAGTKWNFLPFRPGLAGGHCIGVDPYYLTYKAAKAGYRADIIAAGRRVNDSMAAYIAQQTIKGIIKNGSPAKNSRVIVLGLTFKEGCQDIRNSKVVDLVRELTEFACHVVVHDPLAAPSEAKHEYNIDLCRWDQLPRDVEAIVLAVPHSQYLTMPQDELLQCLKPGGLVVDVKAALDRDSLKQAGLTVWRL